MPSIKNKMTSNPYPSTPRHLKENLDRFWTRKNYFTPNFLELRRKYNFLPVNQVKAELEAQGFTVKIVQKSDGIRGEDAVFRDNHLTLYVREDDSAVMNITEG